MEGKLHQVEKGAKNISKRMKHEVVISCLHMFAGC